MECDPKGAHNMASSYRERVYLGIDEEGHEIIKWASGDSKRELHDSIVRLYVKYGKIDRFLAEMQKPLSGESAKKVVLFRDYYEKVWLPEKQRSCKSTTLAGYMGYFRKYLLPEFGDCNLYGIRPFDIQEYFQSIPHLTLKTQKEHYNVLSNLFDYAMDDENVALPRNPVKSKYVKVKYSESDSVIREPLSSEVVTEIISQIGTLPLMERRLMALLLFTGMRRGEVLGLRWEDLDFKTGFITVRRNATYAHNQAEVTTPKTSNGFRSLPLYAQLVEMLGTPKKSGYIIGEQKTPITGTAYQCMFEKIRKTVDLHGATAHVFRHSYLTMLDEAGVDPKTLQYIAGHGNFSFTMNRYVHGRKKAAQEAGVKFEKLINKASDSPASANVNIPSFTVSGKDKTAGVIS